MALRKNFCCHNQQSMNPFSNWRTLYMNIRRVCIYSNYNTHTYLFSSFFIRTGLLFTHIIFYSFFSPRRILASPPPIPPFPPIPNLICLRHPHFLVSPYSSLYLFFPVFVIFLLPSISVHPLLTHPLIFPLHVLPHSSFLSDPL